MVNALNNKNGFSLLELLVVVAIFGVLLSSIYQTFEAQNRSYLVQEQVVAMQQNIRSAMLMMEKEIRMAGFDPDGTAGAGFITATSNNIEFTLDDDENGALGGTGEEIHYELYNTAWGTQALGRAAPATNQAVADNIDALNFVYLNANGAVTSTLNNIAQVQVTVVARTGQGDRYYTDNNQYRNLQGTVILDKSASPDNFRRRAISTHIKCRNLILN